MEAEGAPMIEDGLSYRARKEAFVSGLEGTSMLEVALVVTVVPVGLWLADLAVRALQLRGSKSIARLLVEFCCLVTPLLLSMTLETRALSSKFVDHLGLVVATVASGVLLRWRKLETEKEAPDTEHAAGHVTAFRSGLLLMTCTAILAVDFPVFPRRFAKTETYGTGLMDVGVGGFVVSNAIVLGLDGSYETLKLTMWRAISSTGVLVTIGLARLALTKSVDYQEHASEYGLHWNFFFTLAAVSLGSSVLYGACLPRCLVRRPGLVGLMLLGLHQVLLSQGGLEAWVLHSSRDNLLSQNKEGLTSVIGNLSLFSLGIELGRFHAPPKGGNAHSTPGALIWYHLWCAASLYAGTLCSTAWLGPVSRRLANAGYVLWTLALSQQLLAQVLLLQVALPPPLCLGSSPGLIAEAINYNQIAVFLLANLLTGACNLYVRTLDTENELAVNILFLYLFTVIAVAYGLYCLRQRVKPAHALRFLVSREARATAKTQ